MIFKLEFPNRTEFAQAKNLKKLQSEYAKEFGKDEVLKLKSVTIIEPDVAKTIMLKSNEPKLIKEFSVFDACVGDDFCIIGSTELINH